MTISKLYLWVHPGALPVRTLTLQAWDNVIEACKINTGWGLLETTMAATPSYGTHPENSEVPWNCRVPYGSASACKQSDARLRHHLKSVSELEMKAARLLEERFLFWPHGNFVDARLPQHVQYLQGKLKLEGFPYMLQSIVVYGLMPDVCVEWQAHDFGLHQISRQVVNAGLLPQRFERR